MSITQKIGIAGCYALGLVCLVATLLLYGLSHPGFLAGSLALLLLATLALYLAGIRELDREAEDA